MKTLIKRALLVLLVAIVLVLGYAATRPDTFHVERSISIAAPADGIYARVVDFHQFGEWSPWEKLDPSMKKEFTGTTGAVGSAYFWSGNSEVGEGRMTILEMQPPTKVSMKLEFIRPFAATNSTIFTFMPDGQNTRVSWIFDGKNNFMTKVMGLFMNMDKMIGGDFEKGLANLKGLTESTPAAGGR